MAQHTARRLFEAARPYWGLFLLGVGATLVASVLDTATIVILVPLLKALFGTAGSLGEQATRLERITDWLLDPLVAGLPSREAAGRLVLLLVVALLVKNLMQYASNQLSVAVQEGLVRDLRVRLYRHLLTLDLNFFQRTRSGQLISTVMVDADRTKQAVTASLAALFQNVVLILGTLAFLATISPRLTLITIATAPILILGIRALLGRLRRHSRLWQEEQGQLTATVSERLGAMKLIRAYGGEAAEARFFADQAARYRKRVQRTQRYSSMTSPVSELFGGLVLTLIIWAAANPAVTGVELGAAATIGFLVGALKIMSPLKSISQFPASWAIAQASAERVFALLDEPSAEADTPGSAPARFERDIVFDRVGFAYGEGPPVLMEISFAAPKGSIVAIVGPSGAGKTTLLDLLPRFHDPVSGEIRLDGAPLPSLQRASLRSLLGVVSQDTVLLNDTVHANIAYGRPGATPAQVEAAARAANAADFIAQLPDGFQTLLGERGTRLSGGQRQRIAIARALLRDPPILLLDEATSALDTESERLVQDAIERLMQDRTVLVVAHRLATVLDADLILVLDGGQLVERGTHQELLAENGLYRRLYDLQFRGAEVLA
ncbi:MAG TPA: ABC transporter ATP-binding protein [Gemmatimonadales bacterium]|nr:ABC transporter ATP-binding protein [Gemmatimonadales bacterium]